MGRWYLSSSRPILGVPLKQVCHEMDGVWTGVGDQSLQVTGDTLRPTEVHGARQLVPLRPISLQGEAVVHLDVQIAAVIVFITKYS